MLVLGVETSCDETAAAVVDGDYTVRSNIIRSQQEHAAFGGVVPELASRAHVQAVLPAITAALSSAGVQLGQIDGIAVTRGPGLVGSLLVGLCVAKALALSTGSPLIGVNHLEGHVFANRLAAPLDTPFLTLLVSGGHTELVHVRSWGGYEVLGRTRDDAAGEAFDKVAKLLGLLPTEGFVPGGRAISECAAKGNADAVRFPRGLAGSDSLDFSFSGLKTSVLNHVRALSPASLVASAADIAASFQEAVIDVLVGQTMRAMGLTEVGTVALAGGVAANGLLRDRLRRRVEAAGGEFRCPPVELCTDNAAMIAAAGLFHLVSGRRSGLDLDAAPRLGLG